MGEKNTHSGISRNVLFCLFATTTSIFIFSWFFVLKSAGRPHFIDHRSLPLPLPQSQLSVVSDSNLESQDHENVSDLVVDKLEIDDVEKESREMDVAKCSSGKLVLKVFMYDLPSEFHFELLGWKSDGKSVWPDIQSKIPDYPGGLNLQHSIEYWLTLDLLSSGFPGLATNRSAIRVINSSEADVVFVPFFSSLSYNRHSKVKPHRKESQNKKLQEKLVTYLSSQEEWKRSGGRDHVIMAHHPNSMLDARMKLWPAMFILSDFGRYPSNIANVEKDIIAPYRHVIKTFVDDSSGFDQRTILLYFQGAIYRKDGGFIRQELFYLLKDEKDVHFSFGSVQGDGIIKATRGMHSSKFCLNIAGDTPSSNRLFDAIASHCVPVIISDDIELPYEDILDYSEFCIFVRMSDAVKGKFLINLINSISKEEWTRMWERMKEIEHLFEYQYPSKKDDAVQMIWQGVARKVPSVRLKLHKSRRFLWSEVGKKPVATALPWSKHFW